MRLKWRIDVPLWDIQTRVYVDVVGHYQPSTGKIEPSFRIVCVLLGGANIKGHLGGEDLQKLEEEMLSDIIEKHSEILHL